MQLTITSCRCRSDPTPTETEHKDDRVLECSDCNHILLRDFGGTNLA